MATKVMSTVTGMTTMAVSVVPQFFRKQKMITTDKMRPKRIASHTLRTEARTNWDWS